MVPGENLPMCLPFECLLSGADFARVLFAFAYRPIKGVRLENNILVCVFPVF